MIDEIIIARPDHTGPFYTIEEAKEELKLNSAKLRYKIENGEINPVVFTKKQRFLMYSLIHIDRDWVGHGTAEYRGHLGLPKTLINQILDGGEIQIGKNYCYLLEESGFSDISGNNPYSQKLPLGPITEWAEWDSWDSYTTEDALFSEATPFPKVTKGLPGNTYDNLSKKGSTPSSEWLEQLYPDAKTAKPTLEFRTGPKFSPTDLRISQSDIDQVLNPIPEAALATPNASSIEPSVMPNKRRANLLRELITRIMDAQPGINSNGVWDILRRDIDTDNRVYDIDNILIKIDSQCFEWQALGGAEKTCVRKTLQNIMSDYKKAKNPV